MTLDRIYHRRQIRNEKDGPWTALFRSDFDARRGMLPEVADVPTVESNGGDYSHPGGQQELTDRLFSVFRNGSLTRRAIPSATPNPRRGVAWIDIADFHLGALQN